MYRCLDIYRLLGAQSEHPSSVCATLCVGVKVWFLFTVCTNVTQLPNINISYFMSLSIKLKELKPGYRVTIIVNDVSNGTCIQNVLNKLLDITYFMQSYLATPSPFLPKFLKEGL